jgi:sugar phosphate isomerase/epimerase
MSIQLGATCFFNNPKEFAIITEVAKNFPMVQYVEFRGEHPFCFPGVTPEEDLHYYKNIIQKTHLRSTLHTTMYDINLATLNPWIKDANITCYKEYIDVAAFLESEVIVVHGGVLYPEFVKSPMQHHFTELAEKHLTETLYGLAEYGQPKGVKVALENSLPEGAVQTVDTTENHLRLLKKVDHPNLGALLDFAHAFLNNLDLIEYLEKIKPYLFEIHAHNNFGEHDDHLGLPNGKIDYLPILSHPDVQGVPFIMELKSYQEVVDTLNWLNEHL